MKPNDNLFDLFLIESLQYVDAITPTFINGGGCGRFAQLLSEILKDKFGLETQSFMCILDDNFNWEDSENIRELDKVLQLKDYNKIPIEHVVLKMSNGLILDSEGYAAKKLAVADKIMEMSKESFGDLMLVYENWSDIFDKNCLDSIKNNLNKCFNMEQFKPNDLLSQIGLTKIKLTDYTVNQMKKAKSRSFGQLFSIFSN